MGKGSDSPPQSNPVADATAQGQANVQGAIANAFLNNPNVTNPYGRSKTTVGGYQTITMPDGSNVPIPTFNVDQTLAPAQQAILDSQNRISQGLLDTGQSALTRAQQTLSKPMDLSSVNDIYEKAYAAQTARLDPQWKQNTESIETQLTNQGLRPGDAAWDNAMRDFNQAKNDAYQQAENAAIGTMPQTYQLASAAYNEPLNEVNALRTGSQVQNPTFSPYQGSNIAAAPTMSAQQLATQQGNNIYNAQTASNNATTAGIATLGAGALSTIGTWGPWLAALSDRRLKTNILRIGTHPLGIGIYEYDILGHRQRGLMADEVEAVRPDAVMTHPSGYKMVNYGALL